MRSNNSHHLMAAAQRRRDDTLQRAHQALRDLGETGQRHTITQIATHAGVSRSWLYAQTELRDQLRRLTTLPQATAPAIEKAETASDASLRQRLALAHQRIRDLDHDNHQLRDQIAHLHGQIRANRIAAAPVADTVHNANEQVKTLKRPSGPR